MGERPMNKGRFSIWNAAAAVVVLALGMLLQSPLRAQEAAPDPDIVTPSADPTWLGTVRSLTLDERVAAAIEALRAHDAETTNFQIQLAEIPAPDFRGGQRASLMLQTFRGLGLENVRQDAVGNVLAVLPGADPKLPAVILAAHLDTVFPEVGTISVTRQGTILRAPGIADDAAGLAALVAIGRALREAQIPLRRDIVFVATVGEEGEGDLRGVKHLFAAGFAPNRVAAFMTLDLGSQVQIVNEGVGSRRLHVTVRGPGGHSWGDFGRPNPIHALARTIDAFVEMPLPAGRRSSYNVGVIEGGTGVNVIPESASLRVDLRSEAPEALEALESAFRAAFEHGLERERAWSHGGVLQSDVQVIGDRPVGRTAPDAPVTQAALAAFATMGLGAALTTSSTDANLPMSLGVQALALPHGVQGHEAHSRAEWCDTQGRSTVLTAELLTALALAEIEGPRRLRRATTD